MAKNKASARPILDAVKTIKKGDILPVYCFFGEDSFSIEEALRLIIQKLDPQIETDFDKETFYGESQTLTNVLDFAAAFPFGSGKKLIIFKEFEKVKDKKQLTGYLNSPPEFTVMVLINSGALSSPSSEPFQSLGSNGYLFEAKDLKGNNLVNWLIDYASAKGKRISADNARFLIDIVGENKSLLEAQLEKFLIFLGENEEITLEVVQSLSTKLKEYTIFDLQNTIGKRKKADAITIVNNLLEKGSEPVFIIHMLTRYFTGLSKVNELTMQKTPDVQAARIVGTHPYYYKDYKEARRNYDDRKMLNAVRALLKADISVKTSSINNKDLVSLLIAEIIG